MERSIIDEAKITEHNRFICFYCRRKIHKGLPVIRKSETTKFGFQARTFCHRCAPRQIQEGKDTLAEMTKVIEQTEKVFTELQASSTKALVLEALECKEEEKKRELEQKKSNEEWIKQQEVWAKEREDRDKELEEFRKYKALKQLNTDLKEMEEKNAELVC